MKTLISMTRILAIAVAMFSFASGAWAEHDGDGVAHEEEVITDTEVTGEEDLLDTGIVDEEVVGEEVAGGEEVYLEPGEEAQSGVAGEGEEVIYYTMDGEGAVDGVEGSEGEVYPTEMYDSEGNVVYFRSEDDAVNAGTDIEMVPLMSTTGVAGGAITLADTAADQAGIDSASELSLEVAGSSQADFAAPIDVATVAADGSTRASNGGTATRISGGHLDSHQ